MLIRNIQPNVHKTVDTWVINNINQLIDSVRPPEYTNSVTVDHEFSSEVRGQVSTWKVQLSLNSKSLSGMALLFTPINGVHNVTCNFYLVDIGKNHLFVERSNHRVNIQGDNYRSHFCLNSLRTREELFPNDTMTLRIELLTYLDDNPTFPFLNLISTNVLNVDLPSDFLKLYNSRQDSGDVIMQVQNIEFPMHRCVLEARCPALYDVARYQQTPGSSNSNVLTVEDIDPEIFKRVVEYIYTDKVNDLDDHSEYLLKAADKYKLKNLKTMCEMSLIRNYLTFESSSELLDLAIRCHTDGLKFAAGTVSETKRSVYVRSDTLPYYNFEFNHSWAGSFDART
ncbi:speckle-type POZ protein-like [Microplitis mediator]|uniref:speckle-type POZ protein-like n=1 Tax=Microplitis mediator TaxID=375433 RepID=UPI0025576F7B|nr:speckle-type POZ protein-like [Microplitis mediator]